MSTLLEKDLGKDKSIINYYWLNDVLIVGYYIHQCSSSRISKAIMLHDIICIQYLTFQKCITFENYNFCIFQEQDKETCWEKLVELSVITLYSNYIGISMNKNKHVSSLVRGMPGSYSDNGSGAPANNIGSNVHCTTSASTSRLPKSCVHYSSGDHCVMWRSFMEYRLLEDIRRTCYVVCATSTRLVEQALKSQVPDGVLHT